jgi:hypothetical protein
MDDDVVDMAETVTLETLKDELRDENYPLAREAALEEYGEYVLDLPGGEERVGDVLERVGDGDFSSHGALVERLDAGVGDEGVGRENYTDRGASAGENDQESF